MSDLSLGHQTINTTFSANISCLSTTGWEFETRLFRTNHRVTKVLTFRDESLKNSFHGQKYNRTFVIHNVHFYDHKCTERVFENISKIFIWSLNMIKTKKAAIDGHFLFLFLPSSLVVCIIWTFNKLMIVLYIDILITDLSFLITYIDSQHHGYRRHRYIYIYINYKRIYHLYGIRVTQ